MARGILYVMSTAVTGLIKIGKTAPDNFTQRMAQLENNGYRNVTGLKREFAIEVADYDEKELLLGSLFSRSRVSNTELFSLNLHEVIQLLSSFEGRVIYPVQERKSEIFEAAAEAVQTGLLPDGTYTLQIRRRGDAGAVQATMDAAQGTLTVRAGARVGPLTNISVAGWREKRLSVPIQNGVTLEPFEASSPSMAGSIVVGHNINGWTAWKDSRGPIDSYRRDRQSR